MVMIRFLICFQVNRKILMQNNLAKRGLVVIICLVKFLETLVQNHLTTIINFVRIQFTNKDTRKFVMMSPAGKIDIVWLDNLKRVRTHECEVGGVFSEAAGPSVLQRLIIDVSILHERILETR